jgi:hypothetical protein
MTRPTGLSLALAALLVAAEARAEQKPEKAAESAGATWLAMVDAGRYGASWDAAAELFRKALTRAQWEESLGRARAPLGNAISRKLRSAQYVTSIPGAPAGEYVLLLYDTSFEGMKSATEQVTPMRGADGVWRVSGYYIK